MNEIKTIRALDLYDRYKTLCKEYQKQGKIFTAMEICKVISTEQAPRFYVTKEYAMRVMYSIRNGNICTTRQLKDIYHRWRRSGDIEAAINSPAPSYYLSPDRIYHILIQAVRLK